MVKPRPDEATLPPFDTDVRFVRLKQVRDDGFIEFQFAVGEPDLAVDLILSADGYGEFCRENRVVILPPLLTS